MPRQGDREGLTLVFRGRALVFLLAGSKGVAGHGDIYSHQGIARKRRCVE